MSFTQRLKALFSRTERSQAEQDFPPIPFDRLHELLEDKLPFEMRERFWPTLMNFSPEQINAIMTNTSLRDGMVKKAITLFPRMDTNDKDRGIQERFCRTLHRLHALSEPHAQLAFHILDVADAEDVAVKNPFFTGLVTSRRPLTYVYPERLLRTLLRDVDEPLDTFEQALVTHAFRHAHLAKHLLSCDFIAPYLFYPSRSSSLQALIQHFLLEEGGATVEHQAQLTDYQTSLIIRHMSATRHTTDLTPETSTSSNELDEERFVEPLLNLAAKDLIHQSSPALFSFQGHFHTIGEGFPCATLNDRSEHPLLDTLLEADRNPLAIEDALSLLEAFYQHLGDSLFAIHRSPSGRGKHAIGRVLQGNNLIDTWLFGLTHPNENETQPSNVQTYTTLISWSLERGYDVHRPLNLKPERTASLFAWAQATLMSETPLQDWQERLALQVVQHAAQQSSVTPTSAPSSPSARRPRPLLPIPNRS